MRHQCLIRGLLRLKIGELTWLLWLAGVSGAALSLLEQAFPGHAGDQDTIAWRASSGSVRAPAVRARITAMLGQVAAGPAVASVISPYSARGAGQVSRDGQIGYATVV